MKKLFLGLGAMAGALALVALSSCNGSQKITYKDAEGNDKEVVVKSTSDKNEVAESMTAIAYSDSQEVSKPHTFGVDASIEAKISNKMGDQKITVSADADLNLSFDLGTSYKLDDLKSYSTVNVNLNAPITALTSMSADADFSKNDKINIEAKSYGEANTQYFIATKLDGLEIPAFGLTKDVIESTYLNKYFKMTDDGISSMSSLVSGFVPAASSISQGATKGKGIIDSYLANYKDATSFIDAIFPKVSQEEFKKNMIATIEKYNISISSVNSSEVTFKITPTKEMLGEEYEEYKGDSYVSLTINTLKKLPVAVKFDLADIAEFSMNKDDEDDTASVSTLKGSLNINFDVTVPTIDAESKAGAKPFEFKIPGMLSN